MNSSNRTATVLASLIVPLLAIGGFLVLRDSVDFGGDDDPTVSGGGDGDSGDDTKNADEDIDLPETGAGAVLPALMLLGAGLILRPRR